MCDGSRVSEFSTSLHLRTERIDDAVELLRRAGVAGVVSPPVRGWVPLYPQLRPDAFGDRPELDRILDIDQPAIVVAWSFAEDHGLMLEVFRRGKVVAEVETWWETRSLRHFDREDLEAAGLLTPSDADEVAASLARFEPDDLIARKLGLTGHRWVDAERAWSAFEAGRLPGARLVRKDGSVTVSEAPAQPEPSAHATTVLDTAAALLAAWQRAGQIALAGEASPALRAALAAKLAVEPSPARLERFLLEHDEVAEVFAGRDELARTAAELLRARAT